MGHNSNPSDRQQEIGPNITINCIMWIFHLANRNGNIPFVFLPLKAMIVQMSLFLINRLNFVIHSSSVQLGVTI